jgi:hypothetical protein
LRHSFSSRSASAACSAVMWPCSSPASARSLRNGQLLRALLAHQRDGDGDLGGAVLELVERAAISSIASAGFIARSSSTLRPSACDRLRRRLAFVVGGVQVARELGERALQAIELEAGDARLARERVERAHVVAGGVGEIVERRAVAHRVGEMNAAMPPAESAALAAPSMPT